MSWPVATLRSLALTSVEIEKGVNIYADRLQLRRPLLQLRRPLAAPLMACSTANRLQLRQPLATTQPLAATPTACHYAATCSYANRLPLRSHLQLRQPLARYASLSWFGDAH
jgi:hypothetical protein